MDWTTIIFAAIVVLLHAGHLADGEALSDARRAMLIVPNYSAGEQVYRIEVRAVRDGEHWNADVRILRLFSEETARLDTVTCYKLTPDLAEHAGALWAQRWI